VGHDKTPPLPNREDEACLSKRGEKTRREARTGTPPLPARQRRPLARPRGRAGGREENAANGRTAARDGDHPEQDGVNRRLAAAYSPGRAAGAPVAPTDSSEQRGLRRLATSPLTIPCRAALSWGGRLPGSLECAASGRQLAGPEGDGVSRGPRGRDGDVRQQGDQGDRERDGVARRAPRRSGRAGHAPRGAGAQHCGLAPRESAHTRWREISQLPRTIHAQSSHKAQG
jgi:hypothetical protein